MARILSGDIVWANLDPVRGREQAGRRPVVVISNEIFNQRSGTIIEMAVTSQLQRAGFPISLELKGSGLPRRSWAKIGQIRTLSVLRTESVVGRVEPEQLEQWVDGLNELIDY